MTAADLTPLPEHHFTFGLWTVGNRGRDPFGHEVRQGAEPLAGDHEQPLADADLDVVGIDAGKLADDGQLGRLLGAVDVDVGPEAGPPVRDPGNPPELGDEPLQVVRRPLVLSARHADTVAPAPQPVASRPCRMVPGHATGRR